MNKPTPDDVDEVQDLCCKILEIFEQNGASEQCALAALIMTSAQICNHFSLSTDLFCLAFSKTRQRVKNDCQKNEFSE